MSPNTFWKDKRVLVTGHTGFKGSWLTLLLRQLGASVFGMSLAPEEKSLFRDTKIEEICDSFFGDIRNLSVVEDRIRSVKPEIILHLAAQPYVRESYVNPLENYETNVSGTLHILETIKQLELSGELELLGTLVVTTDKVYENKEQASGYTEGDPLGGVDPYSCSKACVELIVNSYRQLLKSPLVTARSGNVVGGGDWGKDRLIPDLMRGVESKHSVSIRFPDSVRPWQHVLEPLWGYLTLTEHMIRYPNLAGAWNFGPSENQLKTVSDIIDCVERLLPEGLQCNTVQDLSENLPKETKLLTLSSEKSFRELNWRCYWDFETTIKETVLWYVAAIEGGSCRELCLKQINRYLETVVMKEAF